MNSAEDCTKEIIEGLSTYLPMGKAWDTLSSGPKMHYLACITKIISAYAHEHCEAHYQKALGDSIKNLKKARAEAMEEASRFFSGQTSAFLEEAAMIVEQNAARDKDHWLTVATKIRALKLET